MKKDFNKTENLITTFCGQYIDLIVLDLLEKCFNSYCKRCFDKPFWKTSSNENGFATGAIILTAICFESYVNRIVYFNKCYTKKDERKSCQETICNVLNLPKNKSLYFKTLLTEVFIMRDIIAHNHVYEVKIFNDQNWNFINSKSELQNGYGDTKFRENVYVTTKKTKKLKFNVETSKIGFEELFKILMVFDLFLSVVNKELGTGFAPFNMHYNIGKFFVGNLSKLLSFYHIESGNKNFQNEINKLLLSFNKSFKNNVNLYQDNIITNKCPKCLVFGYHRYNGLYSCYKCGHSIVLTNSK